MNRRLLVAVAALFALGACGGEPAPADSTNAPAADSPGDPAVAAVAPLDYAAPAHWVCRPGEAGPCQQPAMATVIAADGQMEEDGFALAGDPPVDCFYAYPTVSRDPGANADAAVGAEEREIVRQQLVRFGNACRLYAPLYRQATLTALQKLAGGEDPGTDREMAFADIKAAWGHYLANDNAGRGVVLIGHSQGAGLLTRLIASEIDGEPVQDRLVSALLVGSTIEVPLRGGVGEFRSIPVCTSAGSVGCVIAYSSFRADAPPPADSLFGSAMTTGMKAACVNPAEIDGSGGVLKPLLPAAPVLFGDMSRPTQWVADGPPIATSFVAVPGLLSAQCIDRGGFSYLAITVNADPADPRTDTINGDVITDGAVSAQWGLHLMDMHLAMGNLVDIVTRQSAEWLRIQPGDQALPPEFHAPPN
jgi:hypothetical protein